MNDHMTRTLRLRLPHAARTTCPVVIGPGAWPALAAALSRRRPDRLALFTDRRVRRLHITTLEDHLRTAGLDPVVLAVPAGEKSKTPEQAVALQQQLARRGFNRASLLIAFGGGMIGDLAGYVAATYHRGLDIAHVPTTLLAMVDSSIGGKTGVNLPQGKNLIGAFHQPLGVYADPAVLSTLPPRELRTGLAEVIKYGVVCDRRFFLRIERELDALLALNPTTVAGVVRRCARLKAGIVIEDERDHGVRQILNAGHTLGHAIETVSEYRLTHGEAIAIGMAGELRLAADETGFPEREVARVTDLLTRAGLPVHLPDDLSIGKIIRAAGADKKRRGAEIRFALPETIGTMARRRGVVTRPVAVDSVRRVLRSLRRET